VSVVGCSGSGKTTLARSLARALGSAHIELDSIYHQPDWTPLADEEFQRQVVAAVEAEDRWVVDGNYSVVRDIVWDQADTVVWFDLPYATVMARTIGRTVRRTVTREELWNGNREPWSNLWSVKPEKSIIAWTATRHKVYRRRYRDAELDPRWSSLRFVRLRSQSEADAFVAGVASPVTKEE
jgi:adenylate kinase family enzyme